MQISKNIITMKYVYKQPLKMTSAEPIFEFTEINVLNLIWKQTRIISSDFEYFVLS